MNNFFTKVKKNNLQIRQSGFLTLEILIAMTILIMMLAVVVMVSFGNQTMVINSQTNAEALNIAQGMLEKAQADGRKDYNLVNPISDSTIDGFVSRISVEQTDLFTKLVTASVEFPEDNGLRGTTTLSSIVTNFNNAVGGDTCSSVILPDADAWKNPNVEEKFAGFSSLTGISDNYPITDIDAYKGKLYVTIGRTTSSNTPTLFVFNIDDSDVDDPELNFINSIDNDTTKVGGINAVVVAEDISTQNNYAYIANQGSKQLQIVNLDVSPMTINSLALPGASYGNSIYYKNGYIYLGLQSSTSAPEFRIIDVHKPNFPSEVGHWPATGSLNNDINNIYVSGRYAYLATADSRNLIVLDISNVSSPVEVGSFSGGGNHGKSIFQAGDILYLGRTDGGAELSILNESDPATTAPEVLDSDSTINETVEGVIVRGKLNTPVDSTVSQTPPALAFLLTRSKFKVLDVSNLHSIGPWGDESLPSGTFGNLTTFEPVLDCEGNNFFVGSNDNSDNGYISIITP